MNGNNKKKQDGNRIRDQHSLMNEYIYEYNETN